MTRPQASQTAETPGPGAPDGDDSQIDILLVDDRQENLVALEAILSNDNYRLVQASSGRDALRHILQTDFAVVVLDVFMPGMDGFEVASTIKLRPRSRRTPIIFLTAGGEDLELLGMGYSLGAVDYLTKPINPEILRAKVAVFVDLFRKSREIARQAELLREAERRERERELADVERANEVRYQRLADSIPHIVWRAARDGTPTYLNRRWREFTGLTDPSCHGLGWLQAFHPDDREAFRNAWTEALERGTSVELEVRLVRVDGVARAHRFKALPDSNGDGVITGWLGTLTDIQDEKAAQAVLEDENRRSTVLAGTSRLLDLAFDIPEIIRQVARRAVPILGSGAMVDLGTPSEGGLRREAAFLPGLPPLASEAVTSAAPPADGQALVALRERRPIVLADAATLRAQLANGAYDFGAIAAILVVPLVARGHAFGVLSLLRDRGQPDFSVRDIALASEYADRAALAFDNARLFREAVEAVGARDEFLSIASHELKTPLTSMGLHVQSLLRRLSAPGGIPPEVLETKLDASYRQVLRLEALVDQLLDVTRIVSGTAQQHLDDVDLVALVRDVGSRLSENLTRVGCEVRLEAGEPVIGRWDRSRIEQVVSNLLTNAAKYGPNKPIEVAVTGDRTRARVSVTDRGIGIAREQQARIFERFERAVSPRQYGGLGLGLYIARHIVEAHGGLIRVESQLGEGATFVFELPRDPTAATRESEAAPSFRHELRGRRLGASG